MTALEEVNAGTDVVFANQHILAKDANTVICVDPTVSALGVATDGVLLIVIDVSVSRVSKVSIAC